MITSWDIYWITRLDFISDCLIAPAIIFGIVFAVLFIITLIWRFDKPEKEEEQRVAKKAFIYTLAALFVFMACLSAYGLVPNTKNMIAIYAIPKTANNEQVQQIPPNFAKLVNKKLQEWMQDIDIIPKEQP